MQGMHTGLLFPHSSYILHRVIYYYYHYYYCYYYYYYNTIYSAATIQYTDAV